MSIAESQTEAKKPQAAAQIVSKIAAEEDVNFVDDAQLATLDSVAFQEIITQAAYDALSPPVVGRMYLIIG